MDRVKAWFRRRRQVAEDAPVATAPRCDFNVDGQCVGPLGHPGTWHRNVQGLEWFGVSFDRPKTDVSDSSAHA